MLKRNIIANFIGQGWTALMGLAFIPLYIQYLGVEAYGLIGVFALIQAWLMLLDVGMTPALSREMARFNGGAHSAQSIRNLLRSVEVIGFLLALLVSLTIWGLSGWLASNWLQVEKLHIDVVSQAFIIMGVVAGLRFIENIYRSSIIGLEKQVTLNVVNAVLATIRSVGAIGVLIWIAPTISAFFIWQGVMSLITVIFFAVILYKNLPVSQQSSRFSVSAIKNIWRFAGGVAAITFLSFLLMQTDKILLSKFLSLEQFGYYSLAALVANSLFMIVAPIDLAFFPRLTSQVSQDNQSALISTFHMGSQLITVFVGVAAVILIVFGDVVLSLWTQDTALAKSIAPLLAILALGTMFNCFMHMPYQLQLANGWTSLTIKVNTIAVILLVPAIFWAAPKHGALGVACDWVILNMSYVIFAVHFMFNRLLTTEKLNWYIKDITIPLVAAIFVAVILRWLIPNDMNQLSWLLTLFFCSILIFLATVLAAPLVRKPICNYLLKMMQPYFIGKS